MEVSVVILAAGQGTRMHSDLPKVLHSLAGQPLVSHVIDGARRLEAARICVVYGFGGEQVPERIGDDGIHWVLQAEQLGTGHAVQQALPSVDESHTVLILYGDVPLVQTETLSRLLDAAGRENLALLTVRAGDPTGYGRIIRDSNGRIEAIVEEKDATAAQKSVREVNTGLMACPGRWLAKWLPTLESDNAQGEYYLTDIVGCALSDGVAVVPVAAETEQEVMGINDKRQLAEAERALRKRAAEELLDSGVTLSDPERIDVRGKLRCGRDVSIDVNVIFEGDVELADGVSIGPNSVIRDSVIGSGTRIHSHCVLEQAAVGENCEVGPFARLRPAAEMAAGSKVGNFVEIKKSTVGPGSKVNHLTYIGDATIGADANVGAGTITCNYDGANKHRTIIGDNAFIGSGVELVAPIEVGPGATVGAGSTVSKEAPAGQLTVERAKQVVVKGWKRPKKVAK